MEFSYSARAFMSDQEVRKTDAQTMLSRVLSTRTEISTILSQECDELFQNIELRKYRHIGQGECGTVFAFIGTDEVIKSPNGANKEDVLY